MHGKGLFLSVPRPPAVSAARGSIVFVVSPPAIAGGGVGGQAGRWGSGLVAWKLAWKRSISARSAFCGARAACGELCHGGVDKMLVVVYLAHRSCALFGVWGAYIRSGLGRCSCRLERLPGTLGEGPGRNERGLYSACFLWGIACLRVRVLLMAPLWAASASLPRLSLSLSLSLGSLLPKG